MRLLSLHYYIIFANSGLVGSEPSSESTSPSEWKSSSAMIVTDYK